MWLLNRGDWIVILHRCFARSHLLLNLCFVIADLKSVGFIMELIWAKSHSSLEKTQSQCMDDLYLGFGGKGLLIELVIRSRCQGAEEPWLCYFGGRNEWRLPLLYDVHQYLRDPISKEVIDVWTYIGKELETRVIGNPFHFSASRRDNTWIY